MALQDIGGLLYYPRPRFASDAAAFASFLLDAADEKLAAVFMAPKTGSITKIHFRTATVTTGATVDVRLETVGGDGHPTGTLQATNTNGAQVIADTDDNTYFQTALTAAASVTAGDVLAAVIVNPSVSPGTLNISAISSATSELALFPYGDFFTASWAKQSANMVFTAEYSGGVFYEIPMSFPVSSVADTQFNSGSTPDERGNIFQVPFKCRVAGAWYFGAATAAGSRMMKLYDSNGSSVLAQTGSLDSDQIHSTTRRPQQFFFTAPATLNVATNYRLTLLPEAAVNVQLQEFTVASAAILDAFTGGQEMHLTTRADAGSWTETTTQRAIMGLLIDQLDDGAGGGAGGGGRWRQQSRYAA